MKTQNPDIGLAMSGDIRRIRFSLAVPLTLSSMWKIIVMQAQLSCLTMFCRNKWKWPTGHGASMPGRVMSIKPRRSCANKDLI